MGVLRVCMFMVVAVLLCNVISAAPGFGGCPAKHKVFNLKPECNTDADCHLYGKICCPNQHNKKSCTERAKNVETDKYGNSGNKDSGTGVYCNGVKCQPWQKCLPDRYTKQLKCQ